MIHYQVKFDKYRKPYLRLKFDSEQEYLALKDLLVEVYDSSLGGDEELDTLLGFYEDNTITGDDGQLYTSLWGTPLIRTVPFLLEMLAEAMIHSGVAKATLSTVRFGNVEI